MKWELGTWEHEFQHSNIYFFKLHKTYIECLGVQVQNNKLQIQNHVNMYVSILYLSNSVFEIYYTDIYCRVHLSIDPYIYLLINKVHSKKFIMPCLFTAHIVPSQVLRYKSEAINNKECTFIYHFNKIFYIHYSLTTFICSKHNKPNVTLIYINKPD